MQGSSGVRDISLYFFNTEHRDLFEFAMSQLPPFGLNLSPGSGGAVSAVDARIQYARVHQSVPFDPAVDDFWRVGWDTIDWDQDERFSRAVHPFFNEQMVWVSIVSPGLREWLDRPSVQSHYLTGAAESDMQESAGAVRSSVHRTPIETAIDSYLYGAGSWFRPEA
jgi:hypothetical protein